jgi:hypothetical protein
MKSETLPRKIFHALLLKELLLPPLKKELDIYFSGEDFAFDLNELNKSQKQNPSHEKHCFARRSVPFLKGGA